MSEPVPREDRRLAYACRSDLQSMPHNAWCAEPEMEQCYTAVYSALLVDF